MLDLHFSPITARRMVQSDQNILHLVELYLLIGSAKKFVHFFIANDFYRKIRNISFISSGVYAAGNVPIAMKPSTFNRRYIRDDPTCKKFMKYVVY